MMPDMTAISAMVASLKGALDIAKAMKDVNEATAIQGQILELQSQIVSAQLSAIQANEERAALIQRVRDLEKEVADLKAWGSEKEQYQFEQVDVGAFAFVPKPETEAAKRAHWLCTNCYEDGKKSFVQMQASKRGGEGQIFECPKCDATFKTRYGIYPGHTAKIS